LNLYGASDFDMNFLDTERAMTGSLTADLGGIDGLPTLGASGDIFTSGLGGTLIGQYEVVPEPSTAALAALGLIGLAARRRRS
jgi:hypothetical protein